ncbi:integrase/recombinase XerC [Catalinimonas alkaloidigena]|uniref:Tyrosine recombinase XerC n=1 Tax=Catalinimonas alkaloidigena TaxID=1075417 RepID=A0A1G9MKD4_9BACT|nr:tyrosine-type recombinase/integrase [Catalinimonas alkaloidigena]SDL74584.1 integrase/recombinase XerC [Catalinimonas alkaloidigena]
MVDSFLEFLQFEKRYSEHTLLSYRNDLTQFEQHLQDTTRRTLEQADYYDVRAWMVKLISTGIAASSVGRKMACLRSFYKYLLKESAIRENPMQRIKSPKIKKKVPVFVPESDIMDVLDRTQFTDDFHGLRDKLVLEMIYGTGIRLSEIIGLKENDISLHNRVIKVLGKRNKERMIPLNVTLTHLLERYLSFKHATFPVDAEGPLIVTDGGDEAYPMFIYRLVRKYLDDVVALEKKSPHVLRHTFATHLLNKGADLNAIKDLLGHSNLAATQVYTHNSLEKMREAFRQAHPKA